MPESGYQTPETSENAPPDVVAMFVEIALNAQIKVQIMQMYVEVAR